MVGSNVAERLNGQIEANEKAVLENIKTSDSLRDQLRELRRSGDELKAIHALLIESSPSPLAVQDSPQ